MYIKFQITSSIVFISHSLLESVVFVRVVLRVPTRCASVTSLLTVQVHEPWRGVAVPSAGPEITVIMSILTAICNNE